MNNTLKHAKSNDRILAFIIDCTILGGISMVINHVNIIYIKSFWIYLIPSVLMILYKPYFESRYKATIGKMVLKLEVTDWNYNYIDFKKSLLRSLIWIIPSVVNIPLYYLAFGNHYIMESTGFNEFSMKMVISYPLFTQFQSLLSMISIADIIVYLAEIDKKQRSLKDYIAKTYVVKKPSVVANNAPPIKSTSKVSYR